MYLEIEPVKLTADSAQVSTINNCDAIALYTRDASGLASHLIDFLQGSSEFKTLATEIKRTSRLKRRAVTVGDLRDQTVRRGAREVLFCERCGTTNSANAGDYWNSPSDHVFRCCGLRMRLVVKRTILVDYAKPESEVS